MTLDVKKYLENLIKKEATISHFNVKVTSGKGKKLSSKIRSAIMSEYGDSFLQDADYLIFFTRNEGWTSKDINKLFDLTDRALGREANKLSKNDFQKLSIDVGNSQPIDDLSDEDSDLDSEPKEQTNEIGKEIRFLKITLK